MEMELAVGERAGTARNASSSARRGFTGRTSRRARRYFFKMIRDGKMPIVGSGENLRSMVMLTISARACCSRRPGTGRANGETYWIADRRPYSMNEIVDTIERLLETEFGQKCAHKRLRLPGFASEIAYARGRDACSRLACIIKKSTSSPR